MMINMKHAVLRGGIRLMTQCLRSFSSSTALDPNLQTLINIVAMGVGSLSDMGDRLDQLGIVVTPAMVTQVINFCNTTAGSRSRRLLRFFSWCQRENPNVLGDDIFNHAIRAFAEMKDITAMGITISDLQKEGRRMAPETFVLVVETLVKSGKEDEAVRLYRILEQKNLLPLYQEEGGWSSTIAIIHALCAKGHTRKAKGIIWHHKDELSVEPAASIVRRSLLHGWCVHGNAKEARRVMDEMNSFGIRPSQASYNDLLSCICERNLKFNPSALVPEAANLMMEMRSSGVPVTTISFNILLSCLGRARRVKEAYRILYSMMKGDAGCSPDWVSYYLVIKVFYLTGRFVRGNRLVDQMLEEGLMPRATFFHGLVGLLCGMDKVDYALSILERMKRCCGDSCGPTYDLLIAKLCRSGKFSRGKSLWDEAAERGIILQCSEDTLDPSKLEVFTPRRPLQKLSPRDYKRLVQKQKSSVRGKGKVKRRNHKTL